MNTPRAPRKRAPEWFFSFRFRLRGSARVDRERVDVRLHHVAECCIDAPMTGQQRQSVESARHDAYAEMTPPVARAFVTGMLVAFVLDREFQRRQLALQMRADAFHTAFAHGS